MADKAEKKLNEDLLALSGDDAAQAWQLAHGLDLQLEACQKDGNSAERSLETVGPWLKTYLGAKGIMVRLATADDDWRYWHFGDDEQELRELVDKEEIGEFGGGLKVCVDLDVLDEHIGFIAATFKEPLRQPGGLILLKVAAQELDNIMYEFLRARVRHQQVMDVEKLLRDPVLETTIDHTAKFVLAETRAQGLLVVYLEDTGEKPVKRCRVYRGREEIATASSNDGSELGSYLVTDKPIAEEVKKIACLPGDKAALARVDTGLTLTGDHGYVVISGRESAISGARLELVQHFAIALGQRLVDYHKEQRYLSQYFAPEMCSRLLSNQGYYFQYLMPRLRHIAILFSDITSFTKISEQILDGPEEVGEFIDYWSQGVVQILFKYGGTFDKMVGDCVIGLFGPPFDERNLAQCCEDAIKCAWEINSYTATLTGISAIDKINKSDAIPGLGVATGVHCGPAMVGAMGPNQDFTAFGREMNNTARLQGVAGFREVLVMDEMRKVLAEAKSPLIDKLTWGELGSQEVKNVQDPLRFYSFKWDEKTPSL